MTTQEFQNLAGEMEQHLLRLDEASRDIVKDIFQMLKGVINPGGSRWDWYIWINREDSWYYVNAYLPRGGMIITLNYVEIVREAHERNEEANEQVFYDATAFLAELREGISQSVEKALAGEYFTWLTKNMPERYWEGQVRLKNVSPESRALMVKGGTTLTDAEKNEFLAYQGHGYRLIQDQLSRWDMNAKVYFNMYACVGRACGMEGADAMTDREIFFRYFASEAERESLAEMDEEDVAAFDEWYERRKRGGNCYYSYCGNRELPAALVLCQDEMGYFLKMHSVLPEGKAQIVRFYNALVKAEYPVYIENAPEFLAWIHEDYTIGLKPRIILEHLTELADHNYYYAFAEYEGLPNDELKQAAEWYREKDLVRIAI